MTHSSVQYCPKSVALPIVFVPGLMGSRLRIKGTPDLAWDPMDNIKNALDLLKANAAGKREM